MFRKRRLSITAALFITFMELSGCASQIMQSMEGGTIADVVVQYGMPVGSYEIGGGERAFVWQMNNSVIIPGAVNTTSTVIGNSIFSNSYVAPSYSANSTCNYVLKARRIRMDIEGPAAWTVTGYVKPPIQCE